MEFKIPIRKAIFLTFVVLLACYSVADAAGFENSLTRALNQFAKQLYSTTAASVSLGTNYIFSPLSCHTVLSLLTLGTGNLSESRKELLSVLGFRNIGELIYSYKHGIRKLNSITGAIVKIANKIFLNTDLEVTDNFSKMSEAVFKSSVDKVDFSNVPAATNTINLWVQNNTENTIKDLVTEIDVSAATTVLINAVYFKGLWEKPFSPEKTFKTPFKTITDQEVDVDMMTQKSSFPYAKIDKFEIEALKMYYEKKGVSMLVILPDEKSNLRQLEKSLLKDINIKTDIVEQLKEEEVIVQLPKFKIETRIDLPEALQRIGIKSIFTPDSGLTNLVENPKAPLFVQKVIQKAFIEVDELGTVAAAATAVIIGYGASINPIFNANRPFIFYIMHEPSGKILFAGKKEV